MKNFRIYLALLFTFFCLLPFQASADLGPKPTMEFDIEYPEGFSEQLLDAKMMVCEDPDCSDQKPLESYGPQHFACKNDRCTALAYGFAPYQKIIMTHQDKTRESNVFSTEYFDAFFKLEIRENDLMVIEYEDRGVTRQELRQESLRNKLSTDSPIYFALMILSVVLTLVLEFVLMLVYVIFKDRDKKNLLFLLLVNIFTLPIVWFAFPYIYFIPKGLVIIIYEMFAIILEAVMLYYLNRKSIRFLEIFTLAIALNMFSYLLGEQILNWLLSNGLYFY